MNGLEEREHLIYMGFPGERPPYHVYEAVQIFNDCGAFPVLVPNSASPQDAAARAAAEFGLQRTAYAPRSLRLRQSGRKRRISCRNGKSIRLCVGSRGTILLGLYDRRPPCENCKQLAAFRYDA